VLRDKYDAAGEGQVAGGDAIWKRRKKVAYRKTNVWHGKESSKGVEELAENSPFPLASEEGELSESLVAKGSSDCGLWVPSVREWKRREWLGDEACFDRLIHCMEVIPVGQRKRLRISA
jgi:hypothetical protein